MPEKVSQTWKYPYGFRRMMNLLGWPDKEEHWMLTAQHVHREAENTYDQSNVTAVLDLPKVNDQICDWPRFQGSHVNTLFSLSSKNK